jgi:hypothetical protein
MLYGGKRQKHSSARVLVKSSLFLSAEEEIMLRSVTAPVALLVLTLTGSSPGRADTIWFSGYEWNVRGEGFGGPGPNFWKPNNVWVDDNGNLHLQVSYQNGHWTCAEVDLTQPLGFGTYQFQVIGRID